jgi:hypothetical protein
MKIREILSVSGVLGDGMRTVPWRFYVDIILWAALLSFLAGVGALDIAVLAAGAALLAPVMVGSVVAVLWLVLGILFPIPDLEDLPGVAWVKSHGVVLAQGYLALCGLAYPISAWRLYWRPSDEDRESSLSYFMAFPLLVLLLIAGEEVLAVLLPEQKLILSSNNLRGIALVFLMAYSALFQQLRRAGEKMRALPKSRLHQKEDS